MGPFQYYKIKIDSTLIGVRFSFIYTIGETVRLGHRTDYFTGYTSHQKQILEQIELEEYRTLCSEYNVLVKYEEDTVPCEPTECSDY